jgi:ADP-heptose:LPS heptosyltransferase
LLPKLRVVDLAKRINNFADAARFMRQCDLVISCDTATAHLAGGMGVPVWTLLPFAPDWRWMIGRDDSVWYPTMRLFRQPQAGDWEGAIARVKSALRDI